ncbi:hypothetical protein C2S52_011200 [Perilla frutescens var. hirtella]|nr:hypothetical protein C2S52_011200 [Perilla frutescens var. hirtella]
MRLRQKQEMEHGGFGLGSISEPYSPQKVQACNVTVQRVVTAILVDENPRVEAEVEDDGVAHTTDVDLFKKQFKSNMQKVADDFARIFAMVHSAPQHILDDLSVKRMIESTPLVGCKLGTSNSSVNTKQPTQIIDLEADDDFWDNPECMAIIQEIEDAIAKRKEIKKIVDDIPKFSIEFPEDEMQVLKGPAVDKPECTYNRGGVNNWFDDAPSFSLGLTLDEDELQRNCNATVTDNQPIGPYNGVQGTGTVTDKLGYIDKREGLNQWVDDAPSFSLGLTQDELQIDCNTRAADNQPIGPSNGVQTKEGHVVGVINKTVAYARRNKKQNVVDDTDKHPMVRRDRTKLKRSEALLSPFLNRVVDASNNVDKIEKELYLWVTHNENADMEEVVFNDKEMHIRRREMLTLNCGEFINSAILDVWSVVLNKKEELRAAESPCRFFATTAPCCYTIANPNEAWDFNSIKRKFAENLTYEIKNAGKKDIRSIEMFFFPIYHAAHFYVICFDLRLFEINVIDNSIQQNDQPLRVKYGSIPTLLVRNFQNSD